MKTKILIKIFIAFILTFSLTNSILISEVNAKGWSFADIIETGDDFLNKAKDDSDGFDEGVMADVSDSFYNVLLVIGIIVALLVGIILGIKWMLASIEDRAKIKEMLIPYIVGCVVIFGAFTIWQTVVDFGQGPDSWDKIHESQKDDAELIDNPEKISEYTESQLRSLWSLEGVASEMNAKIKGTKSDPGAVYNQEKTGDEPKTINQVLNEWKGKSTKYTIYMECKKRDLIETYKGKDGNGKTTDYVRLKS